MREAMLYGAGNAGEATCFLCSHGCRIKPEERGICGVRANKGGILYTLVYGTVIAENVDPIEKKPLFHVYPGSTSYSIATVGCNFRCTFCQNHEISQFPRESGDILGRAASPEDIVDRAVRSGARTISYTYTEPTVYFEYAYDIASLARERGLGNVFVTNGYMTPNALDAMGSRLDAANVDLKSFRDSFYKTYCGARLQPVLASLEKMKHLGVWVEITTLLIPGLNDTEGELREMAGFIAALGKETPWHISRFHPRYHMMEKPVTPFASIRRAVQIGKDAGLKYVYSGNVPGEGGEDTHCAVCGAMLIERCGFFVETNNLHDAKCPECGSVVEGRFSRSHGA